MRSRLCLVLALLVLPAPVVRAADALEPANTYAVIVGVLEWQSPTIGTFSKRHRKDRELRDTLVRRGVPEKNLVLLLDREATRENIRKALEATARRARPGSTFLFYYAGHGSRDGKGAVSFYNYDYVPGRADRPALEVAEVGRIVGAHFREGRVLLMADCCHSGGLADVAASLNRGGLRAASVTSAEAVNVSCGNWTFTQAVLDALGGEPLLDGDADGKLTLGEMVAEVVAVMKYRETQRSGHGYAGLAPDFRLAVTAKREKPELPANGFRLGDWVRAPDKGKRRPGRVVGFQDGQYRVEFYDYSDKRVVGHPASALEKMRFKSHKVGEEVAVLWEKTPLRANVVKVDGDFHLVSYPGWASRYDEWVLADRLVDPARAARDPAEVEWKGAWYPAVVMKTEGEKYYIHYAGYDNSWDEWVTKKRIRFPATKK